MKVVFLYLLIFTSLPAFSQKFISQQGTIVFFSDAPVEDIKAVHKAPVSIIEFKGKDIAFMLKVRDFNFEKALMKEHFKEKYIESDKYPNADFKGKFTGFNPAIGGAHEVEAQGMLTIHGVTKQVTVKGTMERKDNLIYLKSNFTILLKDYNITIPQLLWQNIAEEILITVDFTYRPYEK